ncbi:Dyp-type peroxidase [Variovorax sp. J22R24]|uniref:Dyp-type peroxidase n=1 Tax=Variovorax gracilis TaxID=3053502 RepID=UPI0025773502|nr:Dyp-type peroxidase [Variovorax sp. J22R24]MDM0109061.1 Dyp-type peroxidase [Variovorax sp. J22R24]
MKKTAPRSRQPSLQASALPQPEALVPDVKLGESVAPKLLEQLADIPLILPKGIHLPGLGGVFESDVPGEPEPVYAPKQRGNIQGNVIPGFNKDHQHYLFFRLGKVGQSKHFLRWIHPLVSSMDDVLSFVRAFRAMRRRLGVSDPPMCSTWVNIAFSCHAIAQLVGKDDAAAFGDQSFRQGLAARSTFLGDPTSPRHPGHAKHWKVGGPRNEADVLVIVAADHPSHLETMVDAIKAEAARNTLKLLFEQRGDTLPGRLRGHEHFGFKDGVSQPGVRGKVSAAPGDYITPRYVDPADPRAAFMARPGQILVWPGEFLLGEPRQATESLVAQAPGASNFPRWAALGSYLVSRRLRQDVPAFWGFVGAASGALGLPPMQFASQLVGRWPSGAPVMRTPASDNATLAGDEWANNHFIYNDPTRPIPLRPIPGYTGDGFAQAGADMLGLVCPHFAHIRKSNPRDIATDLGKPADTLMRFLLRRGIPFGPAIAGVKRPPSKLLEAERGLMFISYGATIEQQFEFLTRRWVNSPVQPNFGGHDPVIGQHDVRGVRDRFIDMPLPSGGSQRVQLCDEWVVATGGGYFFSPPIEAIAGVLAA